MNMPYRHAIERKKFKSGESKEITAKEKKWLKDSQFNQNINGNFDFDFLTVLSRIKFDEL